MNDFINFTNEIETETEIHPLTDKNKEYIKIPAQIFNKLEIDLINNHENDIALLRILYRYRTFIDKLLEKVPSHLNTAINDMKILRSKIIQEEYILSLTIVKDSKIFLGDAYGDTPVYNKKLLITPSGRIFTSVRFMIQHIGGNTFQPKIIFKEKDK